MSDASDRPLRIGISACFMHPDFERDLYKGKMLLYLEESMVRWLQTGGVITYLVPTVRADAPVSLDDYVADLDGLLLQGGADVCPRTYGEEPLRPEWSGDELRDRYEIELIRAFLAAGKPILGICRGHQVLNVACGGTLYQDLVTQGATERVHRDAGVYDRNLHEVRIVEGSGLADLYPDATQVLVNSVHHQAIKDVAPDLVVEATSADDGVVEAVRHRATIAGGTYAVGVQWHPEFFEGVDDGTMLDNAPILHEFLAAVRARRDATDPHVASTTPPAEA